MSNSSSKPIVITAQSAKNETDYVTQTVYQFLTIPNLFHDYAVIESDRDNGILTNRQAGAFKANITRRISFEAWMMVINKVPAWTVMNLKRLSNDPSLFEKPHKLAVKLGVLHGLDHLLNDGKPTPEQLNARLLGQPDPKPRKEVVRRNPHTRLLMKGKATKALPAPAKKPPNPVMIEAGKKAWATRRARAAAQMN